MGIISTKNITVILNHKEILKDISMSIAEGKRTVILGPNGSGKSTLLKALAGLLKCSAGSIYFDKQELQRVSKHQLAKQMAILPQGAEAPKDLTVSDLVDYGRFPHRKWWGKAPKDDKECVIWALKQTGMDQFKNRLVSTLSGGERQRAWIAMALAQKPKVLLLDEPTTYLDIAHQLEVMNIVSKLNYDSGISVVMVLHDINHAMQFADEIVILKDGEVFAKGEPEKVITVDLLEKVFGVSADVFINREGRTILVPTTFSKPK
ncbi:MAG: Iron-chelate-transporting ATPase [Massilibacillus sp.]|jgi:iron complex transport system ATP-binding protein|nr:Iron-chelate-transporting ATPase [Massilibacillus sp.]